MSVFRQDSTTFYEEAIMNYHQTPKTSDEERRMFGSLRELRLAVKSTLSEIKDAIAKEPNKGRKTELEMAYTTLEGFIQEIEETQASMVQKRGALLDSKGDTLNE